MVRQRSGLLVLGGLQAVLGLVLATGLSGSAQDATPATGEGLAHPAHIHKGTCDALDPAPLFPLTDVAAGTMSGTPAARGGAIAVETSETAVAETLETIALGGHAINIHLSNEEIGTYIACGDIGGAVMTDTAMGDVLAIGLQQDENTADVELRRGRDAAAGGYADRAWATFTYVYTNDEGTEFDDIRYIECRSIGDGVMLVITHDASVDTYDDEVAMREELLGGLELPSNG